MEHIFDWEKILSFFDYFFYLLLLNILFLICNIPFLIFYFGFGINGIEKYFPFFLCCLLPLAPSLCALIHSMIKLFEFKDIYPLKEYIRGYKKNGKQAFTMGLLQLIIFLILKTNISFFKQFQETSFIAILFILLFVISILMTPLIFLILTRYKMSNLDVIKAAITITIGKPIYAFANLIIGIFLLVLFEITAGTTFLFIGSLYACLLVLSNQKLFCKLESR